MRPIMRALMAAALTIGLATNGIGIAASRFRYRATRPRGWPRQINDFMTWAR
jgi:hypothetical protein